MKSSLVTFAALLTVAIATQAFAAGQLVKDKSKQWAPIQSIQGVSPDPAASSCTTATGTKGTIKTVDPTGYIGLKWSAFTDSTGAAAIVKRKINSNTAYMPESGGTVTINSGITGVKFDKYSTAEATTLTVCVELQ